MCLQPFIPVWLCWVGFFILTQTLFIILRSPSSVLHYPFYSVALLLCPVSVAVGGGAGRRARDGRARASPWRLATGQRLVCSKRLLSA
jgi:hypothetical protein